MALPVLRAGPAAAADIPAILAFYERHAPRGLFYPRDAGWIRTRLGGNAFAFYAARTDEELAGCVWVAERPEFVFLEIRDGALVLRREGPFFESGGMLVAPRFRAMGVGELLTATCHAFWFIWRQGPDPAPPMWARVKGARARNGDPLFWSLVGEPVTGLPYAALLEAPFESPEREIAARWPHRPIPLGELPPDVRARALGKAEETHAPFETRLCSYGFERTERYNVRSLNAFLRCSRETVRAPQTFPFRTSINWHAERPA